MMQANRPPPSSTAADKWYEEAVHFLTGERNITDSLGRAQLRDSLAPVAPFFIILYALLVVGGAGANFAVLFTVTRGWVRGGAGRDSTCGYVANLALADLVKCVFVLPMTLAILLVRNWVFGSFACYFVPMLQDIPLHVSTLTFVLIAFDRLRFVQDPGKPRMPGFVCGVGTWLLAVCIVLPYPIYITYIDFGTLLHDKLKGLGICVVNLVDDMQEYMRGLFICMYVLPLAVTAYLYVRISRELKGHEGPLAVIMYEARGRGRGSGASASSHLTRRVAFTPSRPDGPESFLALGSADECRPPGRLSGYDVFYEAELDVQKERRTHKYLMSMVTVFAICLCPLMVLRLAKLAVTETYENSGHFDVTYTLFVWLAFLPTCTTPGLFAAWRMKRVTKERLRGYLHFNRHRLRGARREGGDGAETIPEDMTANGGIVIKEPPS